MGSNPTLSANNVIADIEDHKGAGIPLLISSLAILRCRHDIFGEPHKYPLTLTEPEQFLEDFRSIGADFAAQF